VHDVQLFKTTASLDGTIASSFFATNFTEVVSCACDLPRSCNWRFFMGPRFRRDEGRLGPSQAGELGIQIFFCSFLSHLMQVLLSILYEPVCSNKA
jgi:hypothetical protein